MATLIKLENFIDLKGQSILKLAKTINRTDRTIYNWLGDSEADYVVHYDARNNKVKKIVKSSEKVVYPK